MEENPYASSPIEAELVEPPEDVVHLGGYGDQKVIRAAGRLKPKQIERGLRLIPFWNSNRITLLAFDSAMFAVAAYELYAKRLESFSAWLLIFVVVVLVLAMVRVAQNATQATLKDPNGIWRYHETVFSEEFCDVRGTVMAVRFQWQAFSGWRERNGIVAIVRARPNTSQAVLTTRDSFADDAQWQAFIELLERKLPQI